MAEQDGREREFDHGWANSAEHEEPSARARMLAARWKESPPDPAPFRADPDPATPRRSSWVSTAVVLGCVTTVTVVLGYAQLCSPYSAVPEPAGSLCCSHRCGRPPHEARQVHTGQRDECLTAG